MIIIPAIDLHHGEVVRLKKGKFEEVTVYSRHPAIVARSFALAGAKRIHVVDLDGSVAGKGMNVQAVSAICSEVNVEVELGGGIRTLDDAQRTFDLGVSFVILGTVVAKDPKTAIDILKAFPGKVGIGIDALEGKVAVQGWKEITSQRAVDLARHYEQFNPAFIVYTDISRDGMLTGVNIEATVALAQALTIPVIASGGLTNLEDVRRLCAVAHEGIIGAITGRAIYEGTIDFAAAQKLADELS